MAFIDRVAERALKVKPTRLLLSLLAFPFYLIGLLLGLLLVVVLFAWGALQTGIFDMRQQAETPKPVGGARGAD